MIPDIVLTIWLIYAIVIAVLRLPFNLFPLVANKYVLILTLFYYHYRLMDVLVQYRETLVRRSRSTDKPRTALSC